MALAKKIYLAHKTVYLCINLHERKDGGISQYMSNYSAVAEVFRFLAYLFTAVCLLITFHPFIPVDNCLQSDYFLFFVMTPINIRKCRSLLILIKAYVIVV